MVVYPEIENTRSLIEKIPMKFHNMASVAFSKRGFMTNETFQDYILNTFDKYLTDQEIKKPVILWTNWHESRCNVKLINSMSERGIFMYGLPDGSDNFLQPVVKAVFQPIGKIWRSESSVWMINYAKKYLDFNSFLPCFLPVFYKAATPFNCIEAFKTMALYPFDPRVIAFGKCFGKRSEDDVEIINVVPGM